MKLKKHFEERYTPKHLMMFIVWEDKNVSSVGVVLMLRRKRVPTASALLAALIGFTLQSKRRSRIKTRHRIDGRGPPLLVLFFYDRARFVVSVLSSLDRSRFRLFRLQRTPSILLWKGCLILNFIVKISNSCSWYIVVTFLRPNCLLNRRY